MGKTFEIDKNNSTSVNNADALKKFLEKNKPINIIINIINNIKIFNYELD